MKSKDYNVLPSVINGYTYRLSRLESTLEKEICRFLGDRSPFSGEYKKQSWPVIHLRVVFYPDNLKYFPSETGIVECAKSLLSSLDSIEDVPLRHHERMVASSVGWIDDSPSLCLLLGPFQCFIQPPDGLCCESKDILFAVRSGGGLSC